MKKLFCLFTLLTILTLTGCGESKLVCETKDKTVEKQIVFKKDKVTKVIITNTYSSASEATAAGGTDTILSTTLKNTTVEVDDNKVITTITGELVSGYKGSKSDVKKSMEEEGYVCK